jgi:2-polyprenyl-6-methoxyphenol hydroxylase-like FAD-dependent oxidoreductase
MDSAETTVLIVGAGPTGLTLACDLARRGVRFRIVEKAEAYFIGSKGKGLQPRSLEVLDDFGIVEQVVANGRFHLPMRAYEGSTVLAEGDMHEGRYPTPSTPYASPLITPQWRVEEALRGLLERIGGRVELGIELVGVDQNEDGATATLRGKDGEERVQCKYLVAADGGRSFVRKLLQVPFLGETWKDERMYVGDVRLTGLDRDAWHSWPKHPDGWLALCPLPSTDAYQFQAQVSPGAEDEPTLELYQRIVEERSGREDIKLTAAPWVSLYQVNVRMVQQYRMGRVFLAGDAAHVHTPAGGQGMNTGIQDCYNLGWKLAAVHEGASDTLLDTYEEERLPVAANVLGISSKLYRQISGDEENLRRDAVTLQLGITYKEMSLSRRYPDVTLKIASGDRAPDSPGEDNQGSAVRLFDFFRGPHFTLLRLFAEASHACEMPCSGVKCVDVRRPMARDAKAPVFVDVHGHVAETYGGGNGECVLVRPDGYVGWIGLEKDLADLKSYPGLDR